MTVQELLNKNTFEVINIGEKLDTKLTKPFCCDLLSVAMSRATTGCVWVTVMGNINTLAVASLTEASLIILAEGTRLDGIAVDKAKNEGITVLATQAPIFETAEMIARWIQEDLND